jgi:diguanylate cyclase (GGDEF)-like protein
VPVLRGVFCQPCGVAQGGWGANDLITVVFIIGVMNLVLGFALAVLLERQITVPLPMLREERPAEDDVFEWPVGERPPLGAASEALPQRWLELLEVNHVHYRTFVEALVALLSLEADRYRDELQDVEVLVRTAMQRKKPEAIDDAVNVLVALNEDWLTRQEDVLRVMADNREQLQEHTELGNRLESLLLDQTTLIKQECSDLKSLDARDGDVVCKAIVNSIGELVNMAHQLRDSIDSAKLLILCQEERLEAADRVSLHDSETGLPNRAALELIFAKWWREDDERRRPLSAALVDLDRFGKLNNQATSRVGDLILKSLAGMFGQLCNSESGLERVYRYAGQRFLFFFGDTGPRSAAKKVEKLRQTLEVTKLQHKEKSYSLTMRAGVTEAQQDDTTATLFERLEGLLESAKHAGRNRTTIDEHSGTGVIQAEESRLKERTLRVE